MPRNSHRPGRDDGRLPTRLPLLLAHGREGPFAKGNATGWRYQWILAGGEMTCCPIRMTTESCLRFQQFVPLEFLSQVLQLVFELARCRVHAWKSTNDARG